MSVDGGGWTVFQKRKDGSVNFYRNWTDYESGFGDVNGESWLGLKWVHLLTSLGQTELRIDLDGGVYAKYTSFSVGNAASKYQLNISHFNENSNVLAGDAGLAYHNNQPFSTYDDYNDDPVHMYNCALAYMAGWWYRQCWHVHLNGPYGDPNDIYWYKPYSFSEMKLRQIV